MTIMTAAQLAAKCKEIAQNFKTLYVLGCIGAPLNAANRQRYMQAQAFNRKLTRKAKINKASSNTFGFDCVCMIKAILWDWDGDTGRAYGGATYCKNGVPDLDANAMFAKCKDKFSDFSKIEVGEAVWLDGHIGVYVGDGLAVECTYRWKDGVQLTAVHNMGKKTGYNGRKWTSHGKLPWVSYTGNTESVKVDSAANYTKSYAGTYKVRSTVGLKLRTGASTSKPILETMPNGSAVTCYGYHTGSWLYVVSASGKQGFCHKSLLKKK